MKSNKDFRGKTDVFVSEDSLRRAAKLDPIKKNGKEKRIAIDDNEDEDELLISARKKESILDYFDDSDENEDSDDDYDEDEDDEEQWDESESDDEYEDEDDEEA